MLCVNTNQAYGCEDAKMPQVHLVQYNIQYNEYTVQPHFVAGKAPTHVRINATPCFA